MRLKSLLSIFFGVVRLFFDFFVFKGVPVDFNQVPLVISGVKRYIRTSDVLSELYCVFVSRKVGGGGPKTGVFHESFFRIFQICAF